MKTHPVAVHRTVIIKHLNKTPLIIVVLLHMTRKKLTVQFSLLHFGFNKEANIPCIDQLCFFI